MSEQVTVQPAAGNPIARFLGVLMSPGETFADVARRPAWLVPLLIYFVFLAAGFSVYSMRADWVEIVTSQVENSPFIQLAPEAQRDEIVEQSTDNIRKLSQTQITVSGLIQNALPGQVVFFHGAALIYATLFVMMGRLPDMKLGKVWLNFVLCLLFGLAYMGVAAVGQFAFQDSPGTGIMLGVTSAVVLMGGWIWLLNRYAQRDTEFHKVLNVCTLSAAVLSLGALAFLGVSLTQEAPIQTSPTELVKSNLGALVTTDIAAVDSLLGSLDVFTLWVLLVLTIGFRTIAKTSTGLAASLTLLPWAGWVLVKMAWAAAFG
jgi:hypothetical protein